MNVYRLTVRSLKEKTETLQALQHLRGNNAFRHVVQWLEDAIAEERERFESTPANEYARGRLNALTDVWRELTQE